MKNSNSTQIKMKTKNLLLAAICIAQFAICNLQSTISLAQATQSSLASDDRERIIGIEKSVIRIEEQLKAQQKEMDNRFDAVQKEMDNRFGSLNTLIYFILGGVFGLIGLIFWDRRSYIKPVKEDISELLNVLRDFAKKQPELAEILRSHRLL